MLICGITLIVLNPGLMKTPWFHAKLFFLLGLATYHFWCWKRVIQLKQLHLSDFPIPNIRLRQFNEIATFILFLVVFTVVLKQGVIQFWWQLILGFFAIVILIMMTVKLVNKNKK